MTSLVKSSSVGPIPPHVIMTSLFSSSSFTASCINFLSSGTVFSVERINPLLYKACPSDARLVLTVSPSKISVPTLKSAIFTYLG